MVKDFFVKRKDFVLPVLISIILSIVIYYLLIGIQTLRCNVDINGGWFGFNVITEHSNGYNIFYNLVYTITDFSQGPFVTDFIIAVFMFIGGYLARKWELEKSPYALNGTGIGKRFIWLVFSQVAAMCLANIIWRHLLGFHEWMPTFACAFSVTPVAILGYGIPDLRKALTGILLGSIIPVYAVYLALHYFTTPFDFPGFAGVGIGLALSSVLATEIYNRLPWMHYHHLLPKDDTVLQVYYQDKSAKWLTYSRVFGGDLSELYFWGSDVSGVFFLLGCLVSYIVNPYSSNLATNLPLFIITFMLTTCIAMFIWGPTYQSEGGAFTFIALLMMGSFTLYCPNWIVRIVMMVISAIIGPPVLKKAVRTKPFDRYLACVAVQLVGAIMVIIGIIVLKLLF